VTSDPLPRVLLDDGSLLLELVERTTPLLVMRATYAPGSPLAPRHLHPEQEEHFDVLSGSLWLELAGSPHLTPAGRSITVPARTVHRARNGSPTDACVVRWEVRPALRTDDFFAALHRASRRGRPGALAIAPVAREFRREWRLAAPPVPVQACLFGMLAPLARVLGRS
jgi:quercetin dioxygenase-like cupin family protein